MAVQEINSLTIEKGTEFEATFNIFEPDNSPANFMYYSGVCKIRKYPTSPKFQSCQVSITASTGEVKVSMGKTTTAALDVGRNYYDVIITNVTDNKSYKIVKGTIIVNDSISV
jgi:hypothetical protein